MRSKNPTSNPFLLLVVGLVIAALTSACTQRQKPGLVTGQGNTSNQVTSNLDPDLNALLKTFSEDVGENGQAAWRKLQSYPRDALISSLLDLQRSLTKDDPRQYSIAFALCNLEYEYQANVRILVSALPGDPDSQNEHADSAASMLGRLIKKGDKSLLRVLFASVPSSDAALGEALADVLSEELKTNPSEFLERLKDEQKDTRLAVYKLVDAGALTEQDVKRLRRELSSLSHTGPVSQVAKEILASPVFK